MVLKTSKPIVNLNPDKFIEDAKAEKAAALPPISEDDIFAKNYKTFPVKLPLTLRAAAMEKARSLGLSLHDYILLSVKEKNDKHGK